MIYLQVKPENKIDLLPGELLTYKEAFNYKLDTLETNFNVIETSSANTYLHSESRYILNPELCR